MDSRPLKAAVDKLCQELADQGLLLEAGWKSYRLLVLPVDAPAIQLEECRVAYYAGCQHLFWALTGATFLDPGIGNEEPTQRDLRRMSMIASELDQFLIDFKKRHPEHFTLEPPTPPPGKPS